MKSSHELHSEYAGSAYREYRASTNDAIRDARSPPPFAADPPREVQRRGCEERACVLASDDDDDGLQSECLGST